MSEPTRTWEERGRWMDKYIGVLMHGNGFPYVSYVIPGLGKILGPGVGDGGAAIDGAMDECVRLEREAEQAKAKQEAASRSPVAALLTAKYVGTFMLEGRFGSWVQLEHIRAAIKTQADRWRRLAGDGRDSSLSPTGRVEARILRRCADELEDK